jgi:hypothetical protein
MVGYEVLNTAPRLLSSFEPVKKDGIKIDVIKSCFLLDETRCYINRWSVS